MHLLGILSTLEGLSLLFPLHSLLFSLRWCLLLWGLSILLILWIFSHFWSIVTSLYIPLQMRSLVLFKFIIVDIVLLLLFSLQLRYLMTHLLSHRFLLPRPCHLLTICLLLFGKVIDLLVILILFLIFWATIDYLYPILPLSLLYPLFLFLRALVRHFLILGGDRQWLMKWLLCTPMAHEILFLYLLVNLQLDVVGSTLLKLVRWSDWSP